MTFFDQNNFGHFYRLQYTMNQKKPYPVVRRSAWCPWCPDIVLCILPFLLAASVKPDMFVTCMIWDEVQHNLLSYKQILK